MLNFDATCGFGVDHAQTQCPYQWVHDTVAERDALLLKLDSAEQARDNARVLYDQEFAIVARIWTLYGNPSYDDLKGRSIFDLVKESIDRAQSAESRLDSVRQIVELFATDDDEERLAHCRELQEMFVERQTP